MRRVREWHLVATQRLITYVKAGLPFGVVRSAMRGLLAALRALRHERLLFIGRLVRGGGVEKNLGHFRQSIRAGHENRIPRSFYIASRLPETSMARLSAVPSPSSHLCRRQHPMVYRVNWVAHCLSAPKYWIDFDIISEKAPASSGAVFVECSRERRAAATLSDGLAFPKGYRAHPSI